jgi:hypothetical protein
MKRIVHLTIIVSSSFKPIAVKKNVYPGLFAREELCGGV